MKKVFALILLVVSHFSAAQPANFVFEHLNVEDGLSNNGVSSIFQDHKGLIWIGTYNGLNQYNGYEIRTFSNDPFDPLSLSDTRVTCILEDSKKNLWIGTHQGGLNLYDRSKSNFQHFNSTSPVSKRITSNTIECLFEDSKGQLWIGTNHGLNMWDGKEMQTFYHDLKNPNTVNSNQIYSIIERDGYLWILTNQQQVNKYNLTTKRFTGVELPGDQQYLLKSAHLLFLDNQSNLWIGTYDEGLLKIEEDKIIQYNKSGSKGLSHNLIKAIVQDKHGKIWVATDGGGINVIDPATKIIQHLVYSPANKNGLNSNAIHSLFLDNAGSIWAGSFNGGVNIHYRNKSHFNNYGNIPNVQSSLSNNSVLSFVEDKNGKVWVGTDGGGLNLFETKTGTFTHYKNDPTNEKSLSSNVVKCLYEDRAGNLWVGSYLGGLNLFDRKGKKFERFTTDPKNPKSIPGNLIWVIFEDSRENLWISTLANGLCIMDRKTKEFRQFKPFTGEGSLGDYNIFSMLEDSDGKFWIGTENNGLNLFDYRTQTFSWYKHDPKNPKSLSSNHVFVLFEDSRKNVWLGTAGGGLNLLNKKDMTFTAYTEKHGLASNIICGITEDQKGNLWLTTGKGVSKFDPVKKTFKNFNKADGLPGNEFNINSIGRTKDGNIYLGGIHGLTVFDPEKIIVNSYIPPVILTDFKIFNESVKISENNSPLSKPISETKSITLSYKAAVFSFEFAALNYTSADKNQYAYKLEGFDNNWIHSGNKREATYTNLDPGEYTFMVKGSNNDGLWNPAPAVIKVTIVPPWWKTLWFKITTFLIIVGGSVAFYKIRTYHLRKTLEMERIRELKIKEAEISAEKLKYENAVMEITKTKLEGEVVLKNSKLASSVMSIVKQNEALINIKENIAEILEEKDESLQKKNLRRIIKKIDGEVNQEQNWNEFEQLFNQIHQNFLQKLKEQFPELTSRDLRLCAYLRMNLNSKEIAPLIGLSVRGVEDMRYRVRKKMGLDTSVNLAEYIISL